MIEFICSEKAAMEWIRPYFGKTRGQALIALKAAYKLLATPADEIFSSIGGSSAYGRL